MTIDDKIRDEKMQYDINREAAKMSVLSSEKIEKYEYLTGEEILHSDKSNRTSSVYLFSFWKSFRKTSKNDWRSKIKKKKSDQKQSQKRFLEADQKSIASLFLKDFLNEEATYELKKIVEMENKLYRDDLIYNAGNKKKDKTWFSKA